MSAFRKNFNRFWFNERGAVTVDYVVLTAAATGLAIAAHDALSGNMSSMTDVVAFELATQGDIMDPSVVAIYNDAFANNTGEWTNGSVSEVFGLGPVLGPIVGDGTGAESVKRRFNVDENLESVTLEFDLYAMDGLDDNDVGYIYIGNQKVGSVTTQNGDPVFKAIEGADGVEVKGAAVERNVELGGMRINEETSKDSRYFVSITVDDPMGSVDFGFGSTASNSAADESFALDNFSVFGRLPEEQIETEIDTGFAPSG